MNNFGLGTVSVEKSLMPIDLIRALFRYKWSIIFGTVVFFVFTYLAIFKLLSPSWNVSASLMLESNFVTQPLIDAPPPSDFEKTVEFHTQKDLLKSRDLMLEVVSTLDLGSNRVIGNLELIRIWLSGRKRWIGQVLGIKKWDVPYEYDFAALKALQNNLFIEAQPDSKLIQIGYSAKSGPEAQATLNTLLTLFVERYHARVVGQAQGVSEYLEAQVISVSQELENAENELLTLKKTQTEGGDHTMGIFDVTDSSEVLDEIKLYLLQLEESQRRARLIRDKREQERTLKDLDEKIKVYSELLNRVPEALLGETRMRREIQSHQDFLNLLSRNIAKARTVATGNVDIVQLAQVVDAPLAQERPDFPRAGVMLILNLIMAGCFGLFVGLFRYMNDDSVYSSQELQQLTGLPMLVSLSRN